MRRNAQKCNTEVGAKAASAVPTVPNTFGRLPRFSMGWKTMSNVLPFLQTARRPLLQRCSRRTFASSQSAVAERHETGKISRVDQDDRIFEPRSSRQVSQAAAPHSYNSNTHRAFQHRLPTEHSTRRQRPRETSLEPTDPDRAHGASAHLNKSLRPRRRRKAEPDSGTLEAWRNKSPSLFLKKVLEPNENALYWKRLAAESRSVRPPILLLQMIIRKTTAQEPDQKYLLDLLPSVYEWEKAMSIARRNGHSYEDLAYYMYILEGKTDDVRCERFLERDSYKPPFIFHFLLRSSSRFTSLENLNRLIDYCGSWYPAAASNGLDKNKSKFYIPPRGAFGSANFNHNMSLLAHHCIRLDPRLIIKLADLAVRYIEAIAKPSLPQEEIYQAQCAVFNHGLKLLGSDHRKRTVQQALPNSFFWEAQRILLAVSSKLKRQLLVDAEGFRAIRTVLAGMPKNHVEVHSSARHASTWPPYLRPGDGMDEEMDPEDNWSRSVRAGVLMQEAGFAKNDYDDAADILQGMSPDGTPTIQQRILPGKRRKIGMWEASIRATRNAHEAWDRFQSPPKAGLKRGLAEYTAMFEKLTQREADENTRALPGDRALNFPTTQEANLTEFEKARIRPPSISQLYERMQLDGIRPSGSCLQILVANTDSMEMARKYLHDSDGTGALYRLMSQEMDAQALKKVPISLISACIQVMIRQEGKLAKKYMIRAIELAEQRLGTDRTPLSDFIWGTILKHLSQHHYGLRIAVHQQLKLSLHIVKKLDGPSGITLPQFVQFSKTMRKIAKRELELLSTEMDLGSLTIENHAMWPLYDGRSRHKDAMHWDTFDDKSGALDLFRALRSSALQMNELFDKLLSYERDSRHLLGAKKLEPLEGMMWRKDPARSEHAYEYMLSLAYLGEFQQMAKLLSWLIEEWGQPGIVQALSEADEPPPYADFVETLCAFRFLAEPMLERGEVESLREAIGTAGLSWSWPDEEAVEAYAQMQEDESINILARVLERVRLSWAEAETEAER